MKRKAGIVIGVFVICVGVIAFTLSVAPLDPQKRIC